MSCCYLLDIQEFLPEDVFMIVYVPLSWATWARQNSKVIPPEPLFWAEYAATRPRCNDLTLLSGTGRLSSTPPGNGTDNHACLELSDRNRVARRQSSVCHGSLRDYRSRERLSTTVEGQPLIEQPLLSSTLCAHVLKRLSP